MDRASRLFTAILFLSTLSAGQAQAITADSADDVCLATTDPCLVTDVVEVTPGATLDFLNRAVEVTGDGRFDFGEGSGQILSGRFEATTDGPAIVAGGGTEASSSGTVTIEARRLCSAGNPQAACLDDANCQLGTCDVRRCTAKPSHFCTSDAGCVGTCTDRRCSNSVAFVRCSTDAECDFGTCPEQLTCRSGAQRRDCSANADCYLGTCSIGEGSVILDGSIDGRSGNPATIKLRAADNVTITAPVDLSGMGVESDGGVLQVQAKSVDIAISGRIDARSGGQGTGGDVELEGENDIVLSGPIDLSGGANDGGFLDVFTDEGDIVLLSHVNISAKSGYGYGGQMLLDAGRDVLVGNGIDALRLRANGHTDHIEGGGGGLLEFFAVGDVRIARGVRMVAMAAGYGSYGGDFNSFAADDFTFDGQFKARARGTESAGGDFQVYAVGDIVVGDDAKIDMRGHYGAILDFESEEGDARFGGLVRLSGVDEPEIGFLKVRACDVTVSAEVINKVDDGFTLLYGRDSVHLTSQGRLFTPLGDTVLWYGNPARPPVVEGKIDSLRLIEEPHPGAGCTSCGDGVLDYWEDCDDGNPDDGDGCDSNCKVE